MNLDSDSDKALERKRQDQRIINAYNRVFGVNKDGMPTNPEGALILEDLNKSFGFDKPAFLRRPDGSYSDTEGHIRDGQRSIKLHIDAKLAHAVNGDANIEEAAPKSRS